MPLSLPKNPNLEHLKKSAKKLLAAHRVQVEEVLIPAENEKDLKEIPAKILKSVKVTPVDHMDQVLTKALVVDDPECLFCDPVSDLPPFMEPEGLEEGEMRH